MCIFIQKQGQKSSKHNKKIFLKLLKETLGSFFISSFSCLYKFLFLINCKIRIF